MHSVLITGSSRGIGKAIANALALQDFSIVVHGRTESEHLTLFFEQLQRAGASVRKLVFDVADREQTSEVLQRDSEEFGSFYGVILNAGIVRDNAFPFLQAEEWDQVIRTNLDSFYNVLKPLIEPMILARKGGRIIVMSSIAGILGNRGQVNYSAAKAGLIGAAKALGTELARKKITVNCIAPGLIETDMTEEANFEHIVPHIPMRRVGTPDEVSGIVSFLLSEQASYITRQTIAVDGGMS